jgi:acyl-homoserine-lactone acylase
MLIANPHFPWEGELRFWESHLTIPGELNVYGASLIGLAGVQIGFNEHVAWTHTVATGARVTAYKLDLVAGDPTSYLYDGAARPMTPHDFTVQVREADGSLTDVTRRLYSSHYGPIFDYPGVGWTAAQTSPTAMPTPTMIARSHSGWRWIARAVSPEFQDAHAWCRSISFVNTIAAGRRQRWYRIARDEPERRSHRRLASGASHRSAGQRG